jgi:hypothetical protein
MRFAANDVSQVATPFLISSQRKEDTLVLSSDGNK